MDSNELVRKISEEVIRRLGGTSTTPASMPTAVPDASANAGESDDRPALILLCGGNALLDLVMGQVGLVARRHSKTTIVLTDSAQRLIGVPVVRRTAPTAEILQDGDLWRILDGAGRIFLPNLSLNTAAKIVQLMPDSLVSTLVVYGLLRGLPVVAARDALLPAEINENAALPGMRQRIERLMRDLSAMGVRVVPLAQLSQSAPAQEIGQGTREKGLAADCGQKNGGECHGCGRCVEHHATAVEKLVQSGAGRVSAAVGAKPPAPDLARYIDHTLLKPDATEAQIRKICEEARQYSFASVCVNPSWVPLCAKLLGGSPIKVCTVIGFPLGATTPTTKAIETRDAIANGASEIDMVINVGALKSGNDELVRQDIEAVVAAAKGQALVKVILETALLSREEKIKACLLAKMVGANFVKTSTGFGPGGATVEDIALMRETVGPDMGVKASGGIRDRATAEAMVAAGATRIGASASVAIATTAIDANPSSKKRH